jgi:hypothetical protein
LRLHYTGDECQASGTKRRQASGVRLQAPEFKLQTRAKEIPAHERVLN